ncbi:hypothetical protein FsymDg_0684 [Candidatus Protofrankia datiscae]|uniref:Uncharacterized protein n=1 Tax=Candidatus Protofrankia datiscae TaxID=2716812 RepID=F8AVB5_9ACTN|nr:hypothetical protein FsymDg_0684 [Candidatus Protofrankia datiscae]
MRRPGCEYPNTEWPEGRDTNYCRVVTGLAGGKLDSPPEGSTLDRVSDLTQSTSRPALQDAGEGSDIGEGAEVAGTVAGGATGGIVPATPGGAVVATGAKAVGAFAVGALALGATALGALAVGALAIGRLAVRRARVGSIQIATLDVEHLRVRRLEIADSEGQR